MDLRHLRLGNREETTSVGSLGSRTCLHSQIAGKQMDGLGRNASGPFLVSGKKKNKAYSGTPEVPRTPRNVAFTGNNLYLS